MVFLRTLIVAIVLAVTTFAQSPTSKQCKFTGGTQDGTRSFAIANQCNRDLRINFQGQTYFTGPPSSWQLPDNGGFDLPAGSKQSVVVSERTFSMRIWGRDNCTTRAQPVQGAGHLWCNSGNCPVPPGGNDETCRSQAGDEIGGIPPSTVIELTLCGGRGGRQDCYNDATTCTSTIADYYDLSSVDGPTLAVSITPINGVKLNDTTLKPEFNCGAPVMHAFDWSKCPAMLRKGADGNNYAAPSATVGCMSPCAFASQYKQAWLSMFANDTAKAANALSHVCCDCGEGHGSCESNCAPKCGKAINPDAQPNLACVAGCSPFAGYPDSFAPTYCYLKDYPTVTDPVTGAVVDLAAVPAEFKRQNPQAYSWQFDDLSSTYLCAYADYSVVFCPEGDQAEAAVLERAMESELLAM